MRVAICDDEKAMHITIENLLIEYKNIRNIDIFIDKFENGYDLLKSEREYEIIFMDYQMDGLDGIETARKLRDRNNECCVIFISAFQEASMQGYEVNTFRFILKPINKEKLFDAIDAYLKYPSNPTSPLSPPNPNAKITLSIQSTPMEKMRH